MDIRGPVNKSMQQQATPLSNTFFAPSNMRSIQDTVRRQIKSETGMSIDYQNNNDLTAIMRYNYITNACNPYDNVNNQVSLINARTIRQVLGQVRTGLSQHIAYLRDISRPIQVNALPVSTTTYGNKIGFNDKIGL
jgi:hypothetical protein|tara:strand:+ start:157 stop:564 length:408 start_codon:yes stop_codon:yes gene_type:complete